jgi:hypothetical protein
MTAVNVKAIFDSFYDGLDDHTLDEDWPCEQPPTVEIPERSERELLQFGLEETERLYRRYGTPTLAIEIEELREKLGIQGQEVNDALEGEVVEHGR